MKMKRGLKISLVLNLVLAGWLACILATGHKINFCGQPESWSSAMAANGPGPAVGSISKLPEGTSQSGAKPFHWSQIESRDYRIYVANLRSIGCPDLTLRDIISADVASLYTARRRALQLSEAGIGPWSRREEIEFVASLLGQSLDSKMATAQAEESSRGAKVKLKSSMPLVFQPVDLERLHLNEGQREAIEQLRKQFLAQIGGVDQDPSDPAYRERWQQAQPETDDMLRGMIGVSAYLDYELEAADNSQSGRPGMR